MKPIATDNYDFERLIADGYAYVDKTDILWKFAITYHLPIANSWPRKSIEQ